MLVFYRSTWTINLLLALNGRRLQLSKSPESVGFSFSTRICTFNVSYHRHDRSKWLQRYLHFLYVQILPTLWNGCEAALQLPGNITLFSITYGYHV